MKQTTTNTWELNTKTGQVKLAQFKPGSIFISASLNESTKTQTWLLIQNEDCKYFLALNARNAKRKGLNIYKQLTDNQ